MKKREESSGYDQEKACSLPTLGRQSGWKEGCALAGGRASLRTGKQFGGQRRSETMMTWLRHSRSRIWPGG